MAEYTISKIKLPNGDICNIKDTTYNFNTAYNANTNKAATMADIKTDNIKPIKSASFNTGKYGQDGSGTHYYEMLGSITPSSFEQMWLLHYIITIEVPNDTTYTYRADVEIYGVRNTYAAYKIFNSYYSKYPIYQHVILEGSSSSYPHEFGYRLASSYGDTTVNKNVRIDIIETRNCTATLFNAPKAYTSANPSNYVWRAFNATSNGLQETGDADTLIRLYMGNNGLTVGSTLRLTGSSIFGLDRDNCAQGISLYTNNYDSTTTSISTTRVYNTAGFDWTKGLFYNTGGNYNVSTVMTPGIDQSIHAVDFRYTDNCVASSSLTTLGLERLKPVYLKGTIGNNGLFYLAPFEVTYNNTTYKRVWTQDIPATNDGYVYWFLGFPYYNSSYAGGYQLNFYLENKLFWYHNGKFQEYIGDAVTVNGHTVNKDVPSDAKFTDNNTTYTFENGTNGFKVTPSGGSAQTVTVTPSITNNVTGSGTSGYLAKFNGTNTITNGPQLGTSTTTFLNNKGEWATPTGNVTGVKGNSESSYRTGQVNLTPENLGAVAKDAELLTTNPFAPPILRGPYISKIDNAFYAADKRWNITATNNSSSLHFLFDGNYENGFYIAQGTSTTITMDFSNVGYFPGYPYGYILISFYYKNIPANITGRVYCDYEPHGIGWHDLTFSQVNGSNNSNMVYKARQTFYNITTIEITITASSSIATSVNEIEMHLDRPDSSRTPFLNKYGPETLYYDLTATKFIGPLEGNVTGNLTGNVIGNVSGTAANVTGTVAIEHGGTGATTAAGARTNLGLGSMATATETNYVKVDGTRAMTGSLSISKAGECGLEVNNTQSTNPNQVAFIVGNSGNGGIFSRKHSKWIVYSDANGNVVLNGNANTATTASKLSNTSAIGGTDRPVYFTNGGVPTQTTYRMAGTNAVATTGLTYSNNLDTGIWYVTGITAADNPSNPGGATDGVIYAEKYSDSWIHEIYGDYRTGQIAVRGKNNGTWQNWRRVLDETNARTLLGVTDNSSNTDVTSSDTNLITARTLYYQLAKKGYTTNTGTVTSITLKAGTGISLDTDNTAITTSGTRTISNTGVLSIGGLTGAVSLADLGLSQALRFIGITSTSLSDGATTSTLVAKSDGSLIKTTGFVTGDVVIDTNSAYEYVWTGSAWERLGGDSSYKTTQTAKSDPTASTTTSTTFIDTISQDANGVITATKKTLPSYVATSAGVTAVTWDSTNNKLTRTINGSAADVVTIGTIKAALALTKSDVGLGNVANSTYAGGTAVTLNNSSKASSTASFYAPTTGGTANTQALVGNGATTAPKWVDISPSITIGAGTGSAAPTVNVTVLGQSGTAKSITTASTSVYGVTKLNDGIASNSTSLAATANSALVAAKKVASSNSTSKLYLVGATSQSTTGVDSYSYQYTYTNSGLLSALKLGLNLNGTEKAHLEWNNTDQSIDFIFN